MIVAFLGPDHREWDAHLRDFRFAYNTAHHSSVGTPSAFLNLGRELEPARSLRREDRGATGMEPRDPVNWEERMRRLQLLHHWVSDNLDQAHQQQARHYNLRRRDRTFKVGDLVLKRQHTLSSAVHNVAAKLSPKFQGPFKVSGILSPVVYELASLEGVRVGKLHVKDLKPYLIP